MLALAATLVLLLGTAATALTSPQKASQAPPQKSSIVFWNMSPKFIDLQVKHVPQTNRLRLAELRQIFTDLECRGSKLREQPVGEEKNLVCTLSGTGVEEPPKPGATAKRPLVINSETIVFIAHYEHTGQGESAIDNWSGAVMLPFLFHAMSITPRNHTFVFAAVYGEAGAKELFKSFTPEERHAIRGAIALDALGLGPPQCFINPFDASRFSAQRWLGLELLQASSDQQLPKPETTPYGFISWLKVDDTQEFRQHDIPSVLIHSVTWDQHRLIGSPGDTAAAIKSDAYFDTYNLLADFGAELDRPLRAPVVDNTPSSGPRSGRRR